jgi:acyl-coenzyme A synthetase/AMP-(fatty) acid ligase/acyl carrier protein
VWALAHSCAFDASVWEIWGALTSGSRLVVVPSETRRSPPELEALLRRERVTVLLQTPTAFRQLAALPQLRLLVLGGETLDFARLHTFMSSLDGHTTVCNAYGPTEGTVYATLRPIHFAELARVPGSMIGRAHAGRELHVLDRQLEPVPVGVCGELYIGGSGVARGYLDHPGLTAERFVPSPFGPPGARLYRTGDLARRAPDGDVQFLGRADQQLKVRGFRVEPGEIERVLEQHGGVRSVAVVGREQESAECQLVAYVVAGKDDSACAVAPASLVPQLRSHARRWLPEHLVPSAFVLVDELPRLESGKLNRAALPLPDASGDRGVEYVAPQSEVEELLAAIWIEVLGVDRIGIQDNFFDLGGHSLSATRLLSRVRARFSVELPLRRVFERPTVAELARDIEDLILGRDRDA